MVDVKQLQEVAGNKEAEKKLDTYLAQVKAEYSKEECDTGILYRLKVCPYKGRECNDRAYIILQFDGNIVAGCHGGKCSGKGWEEMQEAFGQHFKGKKGKAAGDDNTADRIVATALKEDELFHTRDKRPYALTIWRGLPEALPILSEEYKYRLRLRDESNGVPGQEAITNAVKQLAAHAVGEGPEREVYTRVAPYNGAVVIALANAKRQVVVVRSDGWEVTDKSPVHFRYPPSMLPLAIPERGAKHAEFRHLVNVTDADWPLYLAVSAMTFHPFGPFPIEGYIGGPGTGKTSVQLTRRKWTDPSLAKSGSDFPSNEDLMIRCRDSRLVTFDNFSNLTPSKSDDLCRIATGASYARRTKYTDADETLLTAKNPVSLTSVTDVITKADLLDRAVRFILPKMANRKSEWWFEAETDKVAGKVLGLLLDGVASALCNLPTTTLQDDFRMVEFALWAKAAEPGLRLEEGSFEAAYRRNVAASTQLLLDSDLGQKIIKLADEGFRDRTKALAEKIGWERTARACRELVGELRLLAPALEKVGVKVDPDQMLDGYKVIEVKKCPKQ